MSCKQRQLVNFLKWNDDYMDISADKGLGTALNDRMRHLQQTILSEHLSDHTAYKNTAPSNIRFESTYEIQTWRIIL